MPTLLTLTNRSRFQWLSILMMASLSFGCTDTRPPTVNPVHPVTLDEFDQMITQSEFRGLVVVFATWCPPCREELPELTDVYNEYKSQDINIIALSVDQSSTKKVQFLVDDLRLPYPVYHVGRDAIRRYKIIGIPTLMVLHKGQIIRKVSGQQTSDTLADSVKALIKRE